MKFGQLTKKSYKIGLELLFIPSNTPPPPALVKANSEVIDVKTAPIAASKALPPSLNICFAVSNDSFEPVAIAPYFIKLIYLFFDKDVE